MQNFDKKLKSLHGRYINKFCVYDHLAQKLKVYYISADGNHCYFSVDNTPKNGDGKFWCELGKVYFGKNDSIFEDNPYLEFFISINDQKYFKKYFNTIFKWSDSFISKILDIKIENFDYVF